MKQFFILIVCLLFSTCIFPQFLINEEPIVLETETGNIYGTLKIPSGKNPVPLAIIVAGSGPTDRNCNQPYMKSDSFKMLSDGLFYKGIATLCFDKRGIAESKESLKREEDVTLDTYIQDVKEWVTLLADDKRFSEITLIGHSEGSLICMVAAKENPDVSKYVSLTGAGESLDVILKKQLSERLADQPEPVKNMIFSYIDKLKAGETFDNVPPGLNSLFRPSVQPFLISSFRYDPRIEISRLKIPILIVGGTYDLQVATEQADMLSAANPAAEKFIIDKMNHVLKYSDSKDINVQVSSTYNNPNAPVAAELINKIADFIK